MERLTGGQIDEIVTIFTQAFNKAELKELVRVTLDVDLFTEFSREDRPLGSISFELITALERRSITTALLAGAVKKREGNKQLQDFCHKYASEVLSPPAAAPAQVEVVVSAIHNLLGRLGNPEVGKLVSAARSQNSLQQISSGIELLTRYKGLHDCLHMVEVQYYRQVVDATRRFLTDTTAAETLDEYVSGLQTLAAQARATATGLPTAPVDARGGELKWVQQFEVESIKGLRSALDAHDDQQARKAAVRLKSMLITEPPRINGRLTETAAQLPLDELIRTLEPVVGVTAADATAQPLRDGLAGLRQLYPRLIGHIAGHTRWQRVQKELWQAEEDIHQSSPEALEEFVFLWPGILADVQAEIDLDSAADWAADLNRQGTAVNVSLTANDTVTMKAAFGRFRRRAMLRFFEVDITLRDLCGAIAELGEPVNRLLEDTHHAGN